MKLRGLIVLMGGLALGACSVATSQATSNLERNEQYQEAIDQASADVAEAYYDDEVDLERMICKRIVVTGSRFGTKLCMTWREWKVRAEDARGFTNTTQTRTRI